MPEHGLPSDGSVIAPDFCWAVKCSCFWDTDRTLELDHRLSQQVLSRILELQMCSRGTLPETTLPIYSVFNGIFVLFLRFFQLFFQLTKNKIFFKYFFRLLLSCGKCRKPALNQGFSKARGSSFKQKRPTFSRNKDQVKTRTEARFQKARGRGTFPPASYPTPRRASKRRNSHGDKAASHHQPPGGELHGAEHTFDPALLPAVDMHPGHVRGGPSTPPIRNAHPLNNKKSGPDSVKSEKTACTQGGYGLK